MHGSAAIVEVERGLSDHGRVEILPVNTAYVAEGHDPFRFAGSESFILVDDIEFLVQDSDKSVGPVEAVAPRRVYPSARIGDRDHASI